MLDALRSLYNINHTYRATAAFKADLEWWDNFLPHFHGATDLLGFHYRQGST